jgi:RNA polymerase sigma-70 factor (ECF subfamily)
MTTLNEEFVMTQNTGVIWAEVHDALRRFIAKRVTNQAAVEDILQDVFVRVHRQLDRLKDPDRMVSWLYQIARNAIVDYYRSSERRREIPVGLAGDLDDRGPASVPSTDESGQLRTELAACLRPMLNRLSNDYRDAVTLVELEGFTQQAAAERLGLTLSGMKSRVQRGRKQLKQMLDQCCLIQLDRRRGVLDYEVRDTGCDPCGGSTK